MGLSGQPPAPKETSWEALDRQDWHLWVLAILLMFILGVSLLSFMFPTAFWFREEVAVRAPQRAFLGFCVLLGLALVYMLQRQATVRRLRRQLFEARAAVVDAERKAAVQAFLNLPGMSQFRDAVAMEYRRASASSASLALVLLAVLHQSREQLGQVTNLLHLMLRRGETLFRVSDNTLGVVLPGMYLGDANAFAAQALEQISNQIAALKFNLTITAYPEEAEGLAELEGRLVGRIPAGGKEGNAT
jgi:GGDEF domain-containing protein